MKIKNILLIFVAVNWLLCACETLDNDVENELKLSELVGYVNLIGLGDNDYSGVEITLDNGEKTFKVKSDTKGKFTFNQLERGTYNVSYFKQGYSDYKIYGFQFLAGLEAISLGTVALYLLPTFEIENVEISQFETYTSENVYLTVALTISNDESSFNDIAYYLSSKSDVNYNNYEQVALDFISGGDSGEFTFKVDLNKFPIGSTLYLKVYPYYVSYFNYYDIDTGLLIYSGLNKENASETVSIIVPEPTNLN